MKVSFKTISQEVFQLSVNEDQTILDVKAAIAKHRGEDVCPVERQKLIYAGRFLEDSDTFNSLKYDAKKFIILVVKPAPKVVETEEDDVESEESTNDIKKEEASAPTPTKCEATNVVPSTHAAAVIAPSPAPKAALTPSKAAAPSPAPKAALTLSKAAAPSPAPKAALTPSKAAAPSPATRAPPTPSKAAAPSPAPKAALTPSKAAAPSPATRAPPTPSKAAAPSPATRAPPTPSKAAAPSPAPKAPPTPSKAAAPSPAPKAASNSTHSFSGPLTAENQLKLSNLISMGYPECEALAALRAAYFNQPRAVEYLINGIPSNVAAAKTTTSQLVTPSSATSNEPSGLYFLHNNEAFLKIRDMIHANPAILPEVMQKINDLNPPLMAAIRENEKEFLDLINDESKPSAAGSRQANQHPLQRHGGRNVREHIVDVTEEEKEAIDRIKAMGFPEQLVIEAYLACDKNEMLAVNYIITRMNESQTSSTKK